jgi:hypothetical protein
MSDIYLGGTQVPEACHFFFVLPDEQMNSESEHSICHNSFNSLSVQYSQ